MKMAGNTKLVEYGIQTEESDIRAHVGVLAGKVYVYSTRNGLRTLWAGVEQGIYRELPAYTTGPGGHRITTAGGFAVPVAHIKHTAVDARELIERQDFRNTDSTTAKGDKAVAVVQALLRAGRFPLPVNGEIVADVDMQRQGLDIVVTGRWRLQVKCDWRAGIGAAGCTGRDSPAAVKRRHK